MGSTWKLEGIGNNCTLVVGGLLKPYSDGAVRFEQRNAGKVASLSGGYGVRIELAGDTVQTSAEMILYSLAQEGFLRLEQGVDLRRIFTHAVHITFENQLPIGFTRARLEAWLPGSIIVTDARNILVASKAEDQAETEKYLAKLWTRLKDAGVVKNNRVPTY